MYEQEIMGQWVDASESVFTAEEIDRLLVGGHISPKQAEVLAVLRLEPGRTRAQLPEWYRADPPDMSEIRRLLEIARHGHALSQDGTVPPHRRYTFDG